MSLFVVLFQQISLMFVPIIFALAIFYRQLRRTRLIFKLVYLILHILLVVRHSMYYFDVGFINTEFGYNQSLFGVLLIPVTLSFGLLFLEEFFP